MVVSGPGKAEPASGPIRSPTDRHFRCVLGSCPRHLVEEEGGGAEDWDLRNQRAHYGKACSCLESRERIQGSERIDWPFSRRADGCAWLVERRFSSFPRRARRAKKDPPTRRILSTINKHTYKNRIVTYKT